MLQNKRIKLMFGILFVLIALWTATPKVYIHALLHHEHSAASLDQETKLKSQADDDCDFEKYNKPAYFNIFKFICSFLPVRPQHSGKIQDGIFNLSYISSVVSLLRGPPVGA